MTKELFTLTPYTVNTLLHWIDTKMIAIPEIQRPFVWEASKVRNLLDSLYRGYPVGYLITWQNANVKLRDGTYSKGQRILIDGQQRVTALMAALRAQEIINKDYQQGRITIAFHPGEEKFEVANPAIRKDPAWIGDVSLVFAPGADLFKVVDDYEESNAGKATSEIKGRIQKLANMVTSQVGVIDLGSELDIETVTEIFIRVNSAGVALSQADFAMSKIAADENHGGNTIRKAIDYFCHLAQHPGFLKTVEKDQAFIQSDFYSKLKWLSEYSDDIYDPSYVDMLRVAFTSQFGRGRLQDLVALLSGRNFETKQHDEATMADSFGKLREGILQFINENHFKSFAMILNSAGFANSNLVSSQNALNFAYILYLMGRRQGMSTTALQQPVRQWYAMSILTGRYSASPESAFDRDVRQITEKGILRYVQEVIGANLSEQFWLTQLPLDLETSSAGSPVFLSFLAAQVKANDKGCLSRDLTVPSLVTHKADIHHLYPADFLKKQGMTAGKYNQVANFVVMESPINIAISNKDPNLYIAELREQVNGGPVKYGGITDEAELRANLRAHCIPDGMLDDPSMPFSAFLDTRRRLMALKLQAWFGGL